MTEVLFYTHVEDKLQTACQLSFKALSRKMKVMILTGESDTTDKVSRLLWTTPAIGFYPHCRAGHRLAPLTPIIVDHIPEPLVHDQVLINLRTETPPMFSRFHRLIEIVSLEAGDRAAARERYRFYRDRGYEMHTHQLGSDAG